MSSTDPSFLHTPAKIRLAYRQLQGSSPGVIFLGGFKSSMQGIKARTLESWCKTQNVSFTRFDYRGHGESDGIFEEGCIGDWLTDTLEVIDQLTVGPQVLVGSSMGAWLMLLATLKRPQRVSGLLGIASAADFTKILYEKRMTSIEREELLRNEYIQRASAYDESPYIYTKKLIEDGNQHLLLNSSMQIRTSVKLIHSIDDPDVPWQISQAIMEKVESPNVKLTLLKDAGHRLSRNSDLNLILSELEQLLEDAQIPD